MRLVICMVPHNQNHVGAYVILALPLDLELLILQRLHYGRAPEEVRRRARPELVLEFGRGGREGKEEGNTPGKHRLTESMLILLTSCAISL